MKEQLNVPMYYAIKVVIIGCIVQNPPVMSVFIAMLWLIETVSYFCFCCFFLNELFSVLQEICVQRILMNNILLILCLFCTAFFFILVSLLQMHYIFLTLCGG